MGLEKVITRIEKEGEEKVKSIIHDSEKKADLIIKNAKTDLDKSFKIKEQELEKQINAFKLQEKSITEIETKKIRLNAQKEILDSTYQECLKALHNLNHEKIIKLLLKKANIELPEAFYIYSNNRDKPIVKSLSKLTFKDTIDCIGGIIIENKDMTLKLDYRYETIAGTIWDKYLGEIADKLLGDK